MNDDIVEVLYCVELNQDFSSIQKAAYELGVSPFQISKACKTGEPVAFCHFEWKQVKVPKKKETEIYLQKPHYQRKTLPGWGRR